MRHRLIWIVALAFVLPWDLSSHGQDDAATEASTESKTSPAPEVKEEKKAPPETQSAPEKESEERSPAELREEMLERLADQLSKRMRALKERESALSAREESIREREKTLTDRERMLGSMEELMQLREEVIKRREKLPPPQTWNGPEAPSVYSKYVAVLDGQTMQFYYKKAAHERTPVASTQKLVTALVVCRDGDLDKLVTVPKEVYDVEPTVIGVKPDEKYTRRQLLTSLLVRSGNDIAATLAIDNAGSIEAFAEKMNTYGRFIGMTDSNFVNPHGLPAEGQYSNARDIALAAFEAYQNPDIREIIKMRTYEFVFNDGRKRMLYNTNKILGVFEGCNGMKTGFTYAAGNCLVSSAHQNGQDRICVIIKSARPHVNDDSKALLQWSLDLDLKPDPDAFATAE